jgi:transposase-like protein
MPEGNQSSGGAIRRDFTPTRTREATEDVCRNVNVSKTTLYRWQRQYRTRERGEMKELNALRDADARLKRLVADRPRRSTCSGR